MQSEVQFAGFGGQGVMLMGQILAEAAMDAGFEVVWIPSYGPEMRGGTAYCTVVISDRPDRVADHPQPPAPGRHEPAVAGEVRARRSSRAGSIFINASIIPIGADRGDVDELRVPIMEIAKELGNLKAANIVALAAFVARSRVVSFEELTGAGQAEVRRKGQAHPPEPEGARGRAAGSREVSSKLEAES